MGELNARDKYETSISRTAAKTRGRNKLVTEDEDKGETVLRRERRKKS